MSNLDKMSNNPRKCLRPSQIIKSNKIVVSIIECMETQFTQPFDEDFEENKLYNLVSGTAVTDDISDSILQIEETGKKLAMDFEGRMYSDHAKAFFYSIKKNQYKTFASAEKKVKLKNSANEEIKIQKDVLGTLLAESSEAGTPVDVEKVLAFPLIVLRCVLLLVRKEKQKK